MPYTHDEIRSLLAGTTKGEWETLTDLDTELCDVGSDNDNEVVAQRMREGDADFLASSKSIVEQLLEENEYLKDALVSCRCGADRMLTCEHGDWYFDGSTRMVDGKIELKEVKICGKCGKNFILK